MNLKMSLGRQFQWDRSALAVVLSNFVTIGFAVVQGWDLSSVMFIYWGQNVVIGLFNFKRILDLKHFSTEGFQINNRSVKPTRQTQRQAAGFFLVHYGFFHLIYLVFLFTGEKASSGGSVFGIAVCVLIFFANHLFSYVHNRERDMNRKPNIGTVMFFPYARILPMHLTIIFGGFVSSCAGNSRAMSVLLLVFFLSLKTLADLIMHMVEHADARR